MQGAPQGEASEIVPLGGGGDLSLVHLMFDGDAGGREADAAKGNKSEVLDAEPKRVAEAAIALRGQASELELERRGEREEGYVGPGGAEGRVSTRKGSSGAVWSELRPQDMADHEGSTRHLG